jgi:hypothetical protein
MKGGNMAFGAEEIIMFGIQAGVRLYGQARQSYVEKTRERELVIPILSGRGTLRDGQRSPRSSGGDRRLPGRRCTKVLREIQRLQK